MVNLEQLISHRFRGFDPHENSLAGLLGALDFGVRIIEFDIRIARCGTPMVYHDEQAPDKNGTLHHLADIMARDFANLGGAFSHMPMAETLFQTIASHENNKCKLLVDIKDAGFEEEINALIHMNHLQDRTLYVSWLPEVLYTMKTIAPDIALCLSHWCQNPDTMTRAIHTVFESPDGYIHEKDLRSVHGQRSGWFIDGPVRGTMRKIINYICVPQNMISRALVADYHKDNIAVSTFSYLSWDHINQHKTDFDIDLFFVDSKAVFEDL